jgi:2'-5' RNA ligase
MWYRFIRSAGQHTSAIIGLFLDDDAKKAIDFDPSKYKFPDSATIEPADDYHVTLVYLGKVADISGKREQIAKICEDFANTIEPIKGRVGGLGRFYGDPDGDTHPLVALYDSPGLSAMRERLVDELKMIEVEVDESHGFTPHITLAYIPSDSDTPELEWDGGKEFEIRSITLAWADDRMEYNL